MYYSFVVLIYSAFKNTILIIVCESRNLWFTLAARILENNMHVE
jgi:hypothetical protein